VNNIEEVNDIYVGNIEEDIKTVEEKLKEWKEVPGIMIQPENFKVVQALVNVINRLKALEAREKQAKEQIEEAERNLGYAIQMLTDVKEE